jgi:hypothetical protein
VCSKHFDADWIYGSGNFKCPICHTPVQPRSIGASEKVLIKDLHHRGKRCSRCGQYYISEPMLKKAGISILGYSAFRALGGSRMVSKLGGIGIATASGGCPNC